MLTATFTFVGALPAIVSFASLAYISSFGFVSVLAFQERGTEVRAMTLPMVGAIGAAATVIALVWHLYRTDPRVLSTVVPIAAAVIGIELFYFERESLVDGLHELEDSLEQTTDTNTIPISETDS